MFRYKFEYNDACNCHPEYHEVECEAPTVEELGAAIAREFASLGSPGRAPRLNSLWSPVREQRSSRPGGWRGVVRPPREERRLDGCWHR